MQTKGRNKHTVKFADLITVNLSIVKHNQPNAKNVHKLVMILKGGVGAAEKRMTEVYDNDTQAISDYLELTQGKSFDDVVEESLEVLKAESKPQKATKPQPKKATTPKIKATPKAE